MPYELSTEPTIFLIRHGEKPPKVGGDDQEGLSDQGKIRAMDLRTVFGKQSGYDIRFILAEEPHLKSCLRPYDTVKPLAEELNIRIHDSIQRDYYDKAAQRVLSFKGPGNVLICWEHQALAGIAKAIGVQEYAAATRWTEEVEYPDGRLDLVWVVLPPYTAITEVRSEKVSVLDDSVQTNASGDVLPTQAPEVLYGLTSVLFSLVVLTPLSKQFADGTNPNGSRAGVAFIFIFAFFWAFFFNSAIWVIVSEIFPLELRATGVGFSMFTQSVTAIWLNFAASIAFDKIQWRFYFVFIATNLFAFVAFYIWLPETNQLTLEEIAAEFGDVVSEPVGKALDEVEGGENHQISTIDGVSEDTKSGSIEHTEHKEEHKV